MIRRNRDQAIAAIRGSSRPFFSVILLLSSLFFAPRKWDHQAQRQRAAMTIAAILQGKGRDVVQVQSTDSVLSVVTLLADRRIGCVPVVDGGQVVGIFSERDVVYRLAQQGAEALNHTVADVMTRPAITIDDQMPVIHALSLMTKRRIRHLPVVKGSDLIGLVSIGDLVKFRIDNIESEAAALRDYIQTA
ncbi:hypothetical protein LTR94_008874 [Friedmanniomyces endolithicus]|nr:hypothetical protein LTR94_008874 [Friedmanniomyces endolithicus]